MTIMEAAEALGSTQYVYSRLRNARAEIEQAMSRLHAHNAGGKDARAEPQSPPNGAASRTVGAPSTEARARLSRALGRRLA